MIQTNQQKKLNLKHDDLEFFIEATTQVPAIKIDKTILITGEYDYAQRALFNLIDTGSKIKEMNLLEKRRRELDERKNKIETNLRLEKIPVKEWKKMKNYSIEDDDEPLVSLIVDQSIMSLDLRITEFADNEEKVNEILKPVFLKTCMEPSQTIDFTKKDFMMEDYPIESRKHLKQTEFYCGKAREYAIKRDKIHKTSTFYLNKSQEFKLSSRQISHQYVKLAKDFVKIAKNYDDIFHYCIQEAVVLKKAAEIWKTSEQDKKRIADPKRASRCIIPMDGDNIEYVYIPTDKRLIDQESIDLEVLKAGFLQRNGLDATALTVKNIDSFKKNTETIKNMYDLLNIYGGDFNDRGIVLINDRKKSSSHRAPLAIPQNNPLMENEIINNDGSDDKKRIENILDSDGCPELLFEIMEKIEERCFWVDNVANDENLKWGIDTCINDNRSDKNTEIAKFNTKKMIDSIREVHHNTEGKKHISNVMKIGKVVYEKISNDVNTNQNVTEVQKIDRISLFKNIVVDQVERAAIAVKSERREIDVKVINNRKRIDSMPKMNTQIRRERRMARKLKKVQNPIKKIGPNCEILQVFDENYKKKFSEISNQIKRANENLTYILQITEQWLSHPDNRDHLYFETISNHYTQIANKNTRLMNEYIHGTGNRRERCIIENLEQIHIEYDILMLECATLGNQMNFQFFFSTALNSMDSLRN